LSGKESRKVSGILSGEEVEIWLRVVRYIEEERGVGKI